MPKVSIIVPTYNVEMYLDQCMESLTRQTLHDIEIICINDGSTDHSLEILQKYAREDERIIIIDKENGGYGIGMNIGLSRASGEYIGIVEPDDYVPLHMYEDLYAVASENELDFVKADFYRFTTNDTNGDVQFTYNHLDRAGEHYNELYNPSETPELIRLIMNTWSGIYKRAFLEEYHIRHNETPGASFQDNGFFWQTFVYAKRAMFIDKPYYRNRRDNPNSSVNSREKVYCMNVEYDYIRDILMKEENKEIWEKFKYYYNWKRYHNYMFTIKRISDEFKREYVERISAEFRRSRELDEMDLSLFTKGEQERIALLIKNPGDFYLKYCLYGDNINKVMLKYDKQIKSLEHKVKVAEKREADAKVDAEVVRTSTTFRVGKIVMFIPISIKKAVLKLMKG